MWQKLGGDKKGFLTLQELHSVFDAQMPKCFDRDIAFELFRELDSDRDGRLSYKDFYECVKF
jgi:Ca2+-binding EF-hand superfamily protein